MLPRQKADAVTNPFMTAPAPAVTPPAAPVNVPPPVFQAPQPAPPSTVKAEEPPKDLGMGDPFAAPSGMSGEFITAFVGNLLLVKPTEIIESIQTAKGTARNVVRADLAVLDDPNEPGRIVEGVLIFQTALKREAARIYNGPLPYLLGRLNKGKTGGGNDLYTFLEATKDDEHLARQFVAARKNNPL